jgi:hypothetical protein
LQTPHAPPSLAQCLQYLQFLQALHGSAPVQVAKNTSLVIGKMLEMARLNSIAATADLSLNMA